MAVDSVGGVEKKDRVDALLASLNAKLNTKNGGGDPLLYSG